MAERQFPDHLQVYQSQSKNLVPIMQVARKKFCLLLSRTVVHDHHVVSVTSARLVGRSFHAHGTQAWNPKQKVESIRRVALRLG